MTDGDDGAAGRDGDDNRLGAMQWHLQHNLYPPAPIDFAPACVEALEALEEGEEDREIDLGDRLLVGGERVVSAERLAEEFFLDR